MVDVVDGTWRGQISPSNWTLWFDNYCSFVNRYSELSEANDVELFVVGTEFKSSQSFEVNWRQVIDSVRTRFSGKVTYAANWDSYSVSWIEFWDALDYVGVDAYFPLTNSFNPTVHQLINAWSYSTASGFNGRNWTNELYATCTQTGKDLIFTEIGYCSQDGTNTQPWNWNISPNIDLQEQADCYNAALEAFKDKTWFKGWFWWNWETDPNAGGASDKYFTPQNKPAQTVLRQYYYEMPPDLAVTNVACSRSIIAKGFSLILNITLANQGLYAEISDSTVLANDTLLCEYHFTLENDSSTNITFAWNTTTLNVGNYLLNASVKPILGEIDIADNSYQYWVTVTISGDADGDFHVQLADLVILANAYGSMPGMLKWNVNADFDCNDLVGLSDLVMLASNYGNNVLGQSLRLW
jgi:hypothetical protein